LFNESFGEDVDAESCGTWIVQRGAPPAISVLEQSLDEVKALFKENFAEDVDAESHEQKDGTKWIVNRGAAPAILTLEKRLDEVKALYKDKFVQDVDTEWHVGKDGALWIVHRGTPPSTSTLEQRLEEVRSLFKEKFGQDSDAESYEVVDEDGVEWLVYRGPSARRGPAPSMPMLERSLTEAKTLYKEKYGKDVDAESDEENDDRATWIAVGSEGVPPGEQKRERCSLA